jgi:hypothetical protein
MTRSTFAKIRGSLHRTLWQTSSINHPDAKHFAPRGLDSRSSTKNREALWKLPHLWKSIVGGLRLPFLDDFRRCLEKSLAKYTRPFPQLHTAPTTINLLYGRKNALLG